MINKANSISNNNINFKSSFRNDANLEGFIKEASNTDLLDFYNILEQLQNDGKSDFYFLKEDVFEHHIYPSMGVTRAKNPVIKILKQDGEDFTVKNLESIIIGDGMLETPRKHVIFDITRILKRNLEKLKTPSFRETVVQNIKKVLV